MTQLLSSLVQIALLRKDPSVLPASVVLAGLLAIAYAVTSALQSWILYGSDRIVSRTAVDLGLSLALVWVVLTVTRRGHRYPQTINAVLGTSVLVAPFVVLLLLLMQGPATTYYPAWLVARAGAVVVTIWFIVVIGHILRGALETGLVTGVAIALTWLIASRALVEKLFPMAA
jgi:hypothetical protein